MTSQFRKQNVGSAAIGARLRRLSQRMDAEADQLYVELGVNFRQRWYGPLGLLTENESLSASEIASALSISQSAVSQTRNSLVVAGYIKEEVDPGDGRRRRLLLTDAGFALVRRLQPFWAELNAIAEDLDREAGNVSAALDRLEGALDSCSLADRIAARLKPPQ
jgi:MarR family transcriptional regulator, organic hydroperoxide resistance regulator